MTFCDYNLCTLIYLITIVSDINECVATPSPCQQECTNYPGSYECYCRDGYRLASDNRFCNGMFPVHPLYLWVCTLGLYRYHILHPIPTSDIYSLFPIQVFFVYFRYRFSNNRYHIHFKVKPICITA